MKISLIWPVCSLLLAATAFFTAGVERKRTHLVATTLRTGDLVSLGE